MRKLGPTALPAEDAVRRQRIPVELPLLGEGVAKQKCGSCHFFEEAGLAGSGWCHHPQRKVSSDVLIMVRRNELACRDGWSRSLWQPAALSADKETPQPLYFQPRDTNASANSESHRGPFVDDSNAAFPVETTGEDVLLSEARIVTDPLDIEPTNFRASNVGFDPRNAIFRAREAYRDRAKARAAAVRQSNGAEAADAAAESEAPEWPADPTWPEGDDLPPDRGGGPGLFSGTIESEPQIMNDFAALQTLPDASFSDNEQKADLRDSLGAVDNSPQAPQPQSELPQTNAIWLTPRFDRGGELPTSEPSTRTQEPLPEWFNVDLPRICRACRDYRPSVDGERGWCGNGWAFTTRRLVQAQDVAPCQSAIGDWWVPVDDVWLVAADVSAHGRPTPLLDRDSSSDRKQRRRY